MYCTVIKHSGHLRTLEKRRKHSPVARVVYISLVFSNARRVLSQCNTRLRLLYLLINYLSKIRGYRKFSFWISITLVTIYISCIIIKRGKNTFELVGTVLKLISVVCFIGPEKPLRGEVNQVYNTLLIINSLLIINYYELL